jgi:hypothetical protein
MQSSNMYNSYHIFYELRISYYKRGENIAVLLHRSLNARVAQSKNFPFRVNSKMELKNITNTSGNTGF